MERTDDKTKKIYVYADRWYDVRECGGLKLETLGNYGLLFISAVMAKVNTRGASVFQVQYKGVSPNLERTFVDVTKN